jgi:hypothetical protein
MLKTVESFYRDGKVEPTQPAGEPMVEDRPGAIGPSQVLVTFNRLMLNSFRPISNKLRPCKAFSAVSPMSKRAMFDL